MSADYANSLNLLLTTIDDGRIDILRSLLNEIASRSKKEFTEVIDRNNLECGTLLHYACEVGNVDAIRTILASGANPCIQNDAGQSPFQAAIKDDVKKVFIHELLQAVAQSKLARVCQLISSGVPIDSVDDPHIGNTLLHWAACFADENLIKVLCDGGSDANSQNAKGDTPLHEAVRRGDLSIVKKLLIYRADPSILNIHNKNCIDCSKSPEIARCLHLHNLAQNMRRSESVTSLDSINSLLSTNSIDNFLPSSPTSPLSLKPTPTLQQFQKDALDGDHVLSIYNLDPENRHELLWPKPQRFTLKKKPAPTVENNESHKTSLSNGDIQNHSVPLKVMPKNDEFGFAFPDRQLRIFELPGSLVSGIALETVWEHFRASLADIKVRLECEYKLTAACKAERFSGLLCAVLPAMFKERHAYRLIVEKSAIELTASDEMGLWYGIVTLMQLLKIADQHNPESLLLPCLQIDDWPDTLYRGVLVDFTGCRTYNIDTLCKIAFDISRLKANQLVLHFEIRIQDTFSLPYTQKELYRLKQYCLALRLDLIPALELNCEEASDRVVEEIIGKFFDRFSGCSDFVYFGANCSRFFIKNPRILSQFIPNKISQAYLAIKDVKDLTKQASADLPHQCILAMSPEQMDEKPEGFNRPVCLRLGNCEIGYLCVAPDDVLKNLQACIRLGSKHLTLGVLACDFVTGCEVVPRSFACTGELAVLGAAWNRQHDSRRSFYALPLLAAERLAGDRRLSPLYRCIYALGYLERRLTSLMAASPSASSAASTISDGRSSSEPSKRRSAGHQPHQQLSVFVQLLLNPNFIDLEALTPVAFKKVRLELQRCLYILNDLKKDLPYNYELALSVAEVQLIAELMVLASRLGQSLCLIGSNPHNNFGTACVNVGVTNLMQTSRTDLANKLLEIRTQFQHAWLSRNLQSSLPNALKIFDNLFKMLLPSTMQEYGEQLL